ncbi:hypothetical protein I4902_15900 [Proteus alimentorum]|uniref:Uncharacterized protein n=1 Tax=Proteus alimentorum TaxID=1973495 RepID=A0ABS0IXK1_9GAMM|nr:hypothetical protein [Proteus alimentorum]MBG2743521.1 hypothetical protein [Proteus mirabilis]HEM7577975.1 hypothetical protein [Serratia marcescens]MBG2877232.1 hypothetical protein [Proteus alimentorum]MBG2880740.1 hypothetical protein [Proteus alimentorum]HEH1845032.1 hypothetical protein [Proteus mirabilis]
MIELVLSGNAVKLTENEAKELMHSLHLQLNQQNHQGQRFTFSNQTVEVRPYQPSNDILTDC